MSETDGFSGAENLRIHYDTHHANIEECDPKAAIKLAGKKINRPLFRKCREHWKRTIDFQGQLKLFK